MSSKEFTYSDDEGKSYTFIPSENSVSAQRKRLLDALRENPIDTIEARSLLGVLHPAGRVRELRLRGYNIRTLSKDIVYQGVKRTVALYVLRPFSDDIDLN